MNLANIFSPVETISADIAKKELSEKKEGEILLVDVREPEEYEEGHLPGARLIPLSEILDRVRDLDESKPVITYCRSGNRSRSAAALMKTKGYRNVRSMDGGITAWNGLVATGGYEAGIYLIDDRKTPEELISFAWALEHGTGLFYEKSRDAVADQEAKQVFNDLVSAELRHKENLIDAYKKLKGKEISGEILENDAAKGFMESGVSLEDMILWLKQENRQLLDVLEFSMTAETNSLDLYTKIFRRIDDRDTGEIFLALIEEEKAHLARLGKLLRRTIQKQRTVS